MLGEMSTIIKAFFVFTTFKATIILLLVLALAQLLGIRRPAWRCLILSTGLLALLFLPFASVYLPELPILPRPAFLETFLPNDSALPTPEAPALPAPPPHFNTDPYSAHPIAEPTPPKQQTPISAFTALLIIYILGFGIMLFRIFGSLLFIHNLRRNLQPIGPPINTRLKHYIHQLNIHRPIKLSASSRINSPTQIGVLRPQIILPTQIVQNTDTRLRDMALMHELGHIYRWDCLFRLLALCVQILYWFHPLVWITVHQLAESQEQACDDWVVRNTGDTRSYTFALLDIATQQHTNPIVLGLPFARTARILKRIQRITSGQHTPAVNRLAATLTAFLLLSGSGVLACLQLASLPQPAEDFAAQQVEKLNAALTSFDYSQTPITRPISFQPTPIKQTLSLAPEPSTKERAASLLARLPAIDQQEPKARIQYAMEKRLKISGKISVSHIPGTRLSVLAYTPNQTLRKTALVNTQGEFTLSNMLIATYKITLLRHYRAHRNTQWRQVTIRDTLVTLSNRNIELHFNGLGEWRVRGNAFLDNTPLEGVSVVAYRRHPESGKRQIISGAMTDRHGHYILSDLPEDRILLDMVKTGPSEDGAYIKHISASDTLDLRPNGRIPHRIDMKIEHHRILKPGDLAPDFAVIDESGTIHILSDYHGRVVLLSFSYSGQQIKGIDELAHRSDLEIVHAQLFNRSLPPELSRFPEVLRPTEVAKAYGVWNAPAIFLINPQGQIHAVRLSGRVLYAAIDELIPKRQLSSR